MDDQISLWMAHYLGESIFFDEIVLMMSASHLIKGAALCGLMVYIWTNSPVGPSGETRAKQFDNRLTLIAALIASVFAEGLALVLSNTLEFRLRPFLVPELGMQVPQRLRDMAEAMSSSSAFPSDHAILFAAISTGIFLTSRRLGLLAAAYCLAFIAFPRIYLGLHYASDILVGSVIGVVCAAVGIKLLRNIRLMRIPVQLSYSRPAWVAPLCFLFLFQIATMLEDVRALARVPVHVEAAERKSLAAG